MQGYYYCKGLRDWPKCGDYSISFDVVSLITIVIEIQNILLTIMLLCEKQVSMK